MNDFYIVIYDGLYVTTEYEGENLEEALEAFRDCDGCGILYLFDEILMEGGI